MVLPTRPSSPSDSITDSTSAHADATDASDGGAFRLLDGGEIQALLQTLAEQRVRVTLSNAEGDHLNSTVRSVDVDGLTFDLRSGDEPEPLLGADEIVAVAYLDQIRVQFELEGLLHVDGPQGAMLRSPPPQQFYRFQRRQAFRVRMNGRTPQVRLPHPVQPGQDLRLRVADLSVGGLALLVLSDQVEALAALAALPSGTLLAGAHIELDRDTRFTTSLRLLHLHPGADGQAQLGLAFGPLEPSAARQLQIYIDQTQKLSRLLRK